jgi:hypothetical protein
VREAVNGSPFYSKYFCTQSENLIGSLRLFYASHARFSISDCPGNTKREN